MWISLAVLCSRSPSRESSRRSIRRRSSPLNCATVPRVPVRLQGEINSETSRVGQPIKFVVITDVIVGDTVVIKKARW